MKYNKSQPYNEVENLFKYRILSSNLPSFIFGFFPPCLTTQYWYRQYYKTST